LVKLISWGRLAGAAYLALLAACLGVFATIGPVGLLARVLEVALGVKHLPTYRYRLAVTVETPEGLRRGSSVIEVRTSKQVGDNVPSIMRGYGVRVIGEAAVVDLGRRGLLVALLTASHGMWASSVMSTALPPVESKADINERAIPAILASRGARPVPRQVEYMRRMRDNYPFLVRATGPRIADITLADPDHLDAAFGEGVRLVSITVEHVDAPVTRGLAERLPWTREAEDKVWKDLLANPVLYRNGLDQTAFVRND
jgi:hypothetical protein